MRHLVKWLWVLTLFSVAMGFLETTVVVYLREIFYPNGFHFPLAALPGKLASIEILREAATLIMLVCIGFLAGKNPLQRCSVFMYCFGVWDISYYVFLKLLLGWPSSLFTRDILFLIPFPWIGPVLAPCLLSLTLIFFALVITYFQHLGKKVALQGFPRILILLGCLGVILSFLKEYFFYMIRLKKTGQYSLLTHGIFSGVKPFYPQSFNWVIFCTGEGLILTGIFLLVTNWCRLGNNHSLKRREGH